MAKNGSGSDTPEGGSGKRKGGRPVSSQTEDRKLLRAELDQLAMDKAPTYFRKLSEKAEEGDIQAITTLLNRVWPARRGAEIEFKLPDPKSAREIGPSMDLVMQQVATGVLTIEEGEKIMGMLASRIKAFEASEVMEEVRALREALADQMGVLTAQRAELRTARPSQGSPPARAEGGEGLIVRGKGSGGPWPSMPGGKAN